MIEIISIILSVVAIFISIVSLVWTNKSSSAQTELLINERITSTKEKVSDRASEMIPLQSKQTKTPDEENELKYRLQLFETARENHLNAYEEACAKYIDKKVDKSRFKKMYKNEIKQLMEDINHKKFFDAITSKYKAILKVYNEWENLEM